MSTEYNLIEPFSIIESSCKMALYAAHDDYSIESADLEPEDMIAKLMYGVQGCLYSSSLNRADFIKKFVDKLHFEG